MPQFFPSVKWANSLLHRIVVEHLAHGLPHRKRLIYPSLTEHLLFGRPTFVSHCHLSGLRRKMYLPTLHLQIRKLRLTQFAWEMTSWYQDLGFDPLGSWPGALINCFLLFLWRVCDLRWKLGPGDFWKGLGYPHLSWCLEDTRKLVWLSTSQSWPKGRPFPYKDNNSTVMKLLCCPAGWAGEGK